MALVKGKPGMFVLIGDVWIPFEDALPLKYLKHDAPYSYNPPEVQGVVSLMNINWRLPGVSVSIQRRKHLFNMKQGSPEWLEMHDSDFLTSTKVVIICDVSIYDNAKEYWNWVMRNHPNKEFNDISKKILSHGVVHEDDPRMEYCRRFNYTVKEVGTIVDYQIPGCACNVDGIAVDKNNKITHIIEIKNPIFNVYSAREGKFEHMIQVMWNIYITGTPFCDYIISHIPNEIMGLDKMELCRNTYFNLLSDEQKQKADPSRVGMIKVIRIYKSDEMISWIKRRVFRWWNCVKTFKEPTSSSDTFRVDKDHATVKQVVKNVRTEILMEETPYVF